MAVHPGGFTALKNIAAKSGIAGFDEHVINRQTTECIGSGITDEVELYPGRFAYHQVGDGEGKTNVISIE